MLQQGGRQFSFKGKAILLLCTLLLACFSSSSATPGFKDYDEHDHCNSIDQLLFNGTKANESVRWQVDLGPRLPGSNASANLRENITQTLETAGYEVYERTHQRYHMELTNLFARWTPEERLVEGRLVLSAHYDSRDVADQDTNETNRSLPVPGANDAASGVAVLLELARHIPHMNLGHEVVLFFNDAEDQQPAYTLGAEAWAENLTEEDIEAIHAFVLLDMIGDADLQLHNVEPGNARLKTRIVELGTSLGLVNGSTDCSGNMGRNIVQYDTVVGVLDDHVHAHELGIPAIDIMDTSYGEPKPYTFGSYWHTMEDTPDKVSEESLAHVGRLVELGLRTNAFLEMPAEVNNTMDTTTNNTSTPPATADATDASTNYPLLVGLGLLSLAVTAAVVSTRKRS